MCNIIITQFSKEYVWHLYRETTDYTNKKSVNSLLCDYQNVCNDNY